MTSHRTSLILNALGLVLSMGGLFLPWGGQYWPYGIMSVSTSSFFGPEFLANSFIGFELLAAEIAFVGCVFTAVSLVRKEGSQGRYLDLRLTGGLITLLSSLLWILFTNAFPVGIFTPNFLSDLPWTALYGAYISLAGAVITVAISSANRLSKNN